MFAHNTARGWFLLSRRQSPSANYCVTQLFCILHMLSVCRVGPGVGLFCDEYGQGEVGPVEVVARRPVTAKTEQLPQRNGISFLMYHLSSKTSATESANLSRSVWLFSFHIINCISLSERTSSCQSICDPQYNYLCT